MMKSIWNSLFAALLVCVWTAVPLSRANAIGAATLVKAGEELKIVFSTATAATGKTLLTKLVNAEGKVVQTLVTEATPAATLRNFAPSKISQQMKAVQAEVNAAKGFSVARVMKEKLFSFPKESAGFFLALGAVMTFELMFNEANNPVAMEQLVDSQMDPVGQLAFYFFMVANGAAAEPLMTAVQKGRLHPRLGKFIPFFGMGLGSVASNIVHELGHAPNMWKCVRTMLKAQGLDPACDKAAESWNERGGSLGIANEWGPGLTSLVGSVIISGYIQSAIGATAGFVKNYVIERGIVTTSLRITANWTAQQVIKVAGIEVATLFIPGGLPFKIVRWGLKLAVFVGGLFLFTETEERIRRPFAFAYHNAWDQGPAFRDLEQDLIQDILRLKLNSWNPDAAKKPGTDESTEFDSQLQKFQKLMGAWRQTNMAEVLEAHANWQQKLSQLSLTYGGASNFYQDFINQQREKYFGDFKEAYRNGTSIVITDRIFPLNGITADTITDTVAYLSAPKDVEEVQMNKVRKVIDSYSKGLLFQGPFAFGPGEGQLSASESTRLKEFLIGLMSPDIKVVGKAIDQLNCQLFYRSDKELVPCKYDIAPKNLFKHLSAIRTALGDPRPVWKAGLGYVNSFQMTAENKAIADNAKFNTVWGLFATTKFGDSMLASMVFGPDVEKGEPVITDDEGFKAVFNPPKITRAEDQVKIVRPTGPGLPMVLTLFDTPLVINGNKNYANSYEYLRGGNIRTSVFNSNEKSFSNWWEKNAETPYVNAWANFEEKYQDIIQKMISSLWKTADSRWNRGSVANGVMESLKQEYNFYLLVLGEILKDKMVATQGSVTAQFLTPPRQMDIANLPIQKERTDLFAFLRRDYNLQFSEIMKSQGIQVAQEVRHQGNQNFIWQNSVVKDFKGLEDLVAQIRPVEINRKGQRVIVTSTTAPNSKFQEVSKTASENLKVIKQTFFANQENALGLQFNAFETKLIELCFTGLDSIGSEITNLGLIANSVSYVAQKEGGFQKQRCVAPPTASGMVNRGAQYVQSKMAGCE